MHLVSILQLFFYIVFLVHEIERCCFIRCSHFQFHLAFSQPTDESNSDIAIIVAAVVSSAILLIIIIVIILYCCCCKKSIKRKLLFGQQTAESRETDDKLPLTETVDNEKHSSDAINPGTYTCICWYYLLIFSIEHYKEIHYCRI